MQEQAPKQEEKPPAIPKPTREEINDLPLQAFSGRTVLVDSRLNLDSALRDLQKEPILGFDTETRPACQLAYQVIAAGLMAK